MTKPKFPKTLPDGLCFDECRTAPAGDDDALPAIAFDPVPRQRRRRNGWSEERQRGFIAALARCGSVAAAAREVGMTARNAYRLCDAPGADSFVAAWDAAIDEGIARVRLDGLERSLKGGYVPIYRRGKLVRVEHRRNDRLAIAVLGGRERTADDLRRSALSRREHRLDLFALDAARAEHQASLAEADRALKAEVDRLVGTIKDRCAERAGPRITRL